MLNMNVPDFNVGIPLTVKMSYAAWGFMARRDIGIIIPMVKKYISITWDLKYSLINSFLFFSSRILRELK